MKSNIKPKANDLIATDYGNTRAGKKLKKWMAQEGISLSKPPRNGTKRHNQYMRMLRAVGFFAELEFMNGGNYEETP